MKLNSEKFNRLEQLLRERILILDGAMGTMIDSARNDCACHDQDHGGDSCTSHTAPADLLVDTNPSLITSIHEEYLKAGADIIETDSFNSNPISLADYGLQDRAYELSKKAAQLAREAADKYSRLTPHKPRFVAGSAGPTKMMLSLAEEDNLNFDNFAEAYYLQISGLIDGGADIILLETAFDTLNVKAALYAVKRLEEERGEKIPVMVSATVAEDTGRLLSGQTIEAFFASVRHASLISIGLNCGFGARSMVPFIRKLDAVADVAVSLYPNAGLPNEEGSYDETPSEFIENIRVIFEDRLANIVGGCCGTTPEHIRLLSELASEYPPRKIPECKKGLLLSNLEMVDLNALEGLVHVGERTNVAGSRKFARLVREGKWDEAAEIAERQVSAGARVIDICMDDAMADTSANMTAFLKRISGDAEIGKVALMIDSSSWDVVISALKRLQGKAIVNSISLKDGKEDFLEKARQIRNLGAAVIVMLFDEEGQAVTFERKCEIARRSYDLLIDAGFPAEDIVFDPNVLTVGTGLEENDLVALDFIKATEWIKRNLPGAGVSGGISNLSFAFRGNNPLREAMHSAFIYHAVKAGLDMAIVNSEQLALYDSIEPELLEKIEDLLLCRRPDAGERLSQHAAGMLEQIAENAPGENVEKREAMLPEKIEDSLLRGNDSQISEFMLEALNVTPPEKIIETYLMSAMEKVGKLFGEGKMFLPQVIRSAKVMHKAVETLAPHLEESRKRQAEGNIVIATVKGDVHDIGKNIVALVCGCNGFDVVDLGVRVDEKDIADAVEKNRPLAVLLSGLIAPSLTEMINVCRELERRGFKVPVIVGGAATSELHTAVKIAPEYSGPVFYSRDANVNAAILNNLKGEKALSYIEKNSLRQQELKELYESKVIGGQKTVDFSQRESRKKSDVEVFLPEEFREAVFTNLPIEEVEPLIDWKMLTASLDLENVSRSDDHELRDKEKETILRDAKNLLVKIKRNGEIKLNGIVRLFPAIGVGDDIILDKGKDEKTVLPMLRGNSSESQYTCAADMLSENADCLALFAVTAGIGLDELEKKFYDESDPYSAVLSKLLADRLAEAFAVWIHQFVAKVLWGYDKGVSGENNIVSGVRIAFGYPAAPDHSLKKDVFELLDVEEKTGMSLTENFMINPGESVCGMIFSTGNYFNVGKLDDRAIQNYARRRGCQTEELKKLLPHNIL